MPKCVLRMGPPKPKKLKLENGAGGPQSTTPSLPPTPTTSSPGTPQPEEEEKKNGNKRRRSGEEQVPLTPLQKARDMSNKLLKKKSDASNLGLTLQSIPYADALSNEMTGFAKKFELLGIFLDSVLHVNSSLRFNFGGIMNFRHCTQGALLEGPGPCE